MNKSSNLHSHRKCIKHRSLNKVYLLLLLFLTIESGSAILYHIKITLYDPDRFLPQNEILNPDPFDK